MKAPQDDIIIIENATKEYSSGLATFQALKGANLRIRRGEFVSIIGPSGSGKSTLLHLLGCLDKPTYGEVYLDGAPLSKMDDNALAEARNSKIGFVFQAFNLAPTLSVFKNVGLPLMIRDADEAEISRRVTELLDAVGLSGKQASKPSQLSGGEKQRVAIARALANNPAVILADEPTGNLDSKSGKDVMDFLAALWKQHGVTVIVVTHEPVVAAYSERVIQLRDGRIEKDAAQKPKIPDNKDSIKIKEVLQ
ncbi:putative ABC transporter ATP-binding protein [uncultured archaeon]|nr:putative ABC transporter ATP-binding protein [uncultured archaeon]